MNKYGVNVHLDMVISTEVLANSEEEALRLAIAKVEGESLDEFADCCGTNACITFCEDATEDDEYFKIGESKVVDGEVMIKPDYYDDGLSFGNIFKDAETYEKDWDAVCYVPEHAFDDMEPDNEGFYEVYGYSHNDLLRLCNGNREMCDWLFHDKLIWAYPETYMDEMDDEDLAYFYRFITPGAKVWWNDPAGETSGEYTVYGVPFEFDEHGEPIEPDTFALDAVIIIGYENSEAEVTPAELTPVYD